MTLDETADYISDGLPAYQRSANLEWLQKVHATLKDGGIWAYPRAQMLFTKTEDGFEVLLDS